MPNSLGPNGLELKTRTEIIEELNTAFRGIYGADINLASNSPDGQMIGIFAQAIVDQSNLLMQVYNSFNPDNAIGVILDQRVSINGIQRQAGTFTITPITVVTSQACNLYGLDQDAQPVYTIQDNAGTRWQLLETQLIGSATTSVFNFRAQERGATLTVPNTITIPVTIVLGVTSVNNPTLFSSLGLNEETDAVLKIRRQKSVSLASQGYLAALVAALENINGLTSVFVYENNTASTDGDGVPAHSIWVIVSGTAEDADIAQAIYTKRNAGAGMKGDSTFLITQVDGSPFLVRWDTVLSENLFIFFTATSINGVDQPDLITIRPGLVESFVPGVNQEINVNALATRVQELDDNTLVTNAGFSTGREQRLLFSSTPASGDYKIRYNGNNSAAINWNDNIATIEGKIQAIPGLGSATASFDGDDLVVDLSAVTTIQTLLTIVDNTLQDSGPADVDITLDVDLQTTLTPSSKRFQFAVSEENIVITPMLFLPPTATVLTSGTRQFTAYGGYGEYTFDISIDNSGASIDANGLYTAGGSPGVDTVRVTDELGNTQTATVTVT